MSRRIVWLVVMMGVCGACEANKIAGPGPALLTPVQLQWSAVPGTTNGSNPCQPTVNVSMSGPSGARLTWIGMAFHIQEGPYNQDFDQAFTQRFWAGDGLASGESVSSNSAGFGSGFVHITYVFRYTLTTDGATHTDSVSTLCQ